MLFRSLVIKGEAGARETLQSWRGRYWDVKVIDVRFEMYSFDVVIYNESVNAESHSVQCK